MAEGIISNANSERKTLAPKVSSNQQSNQTPILMHSNGAKDANKIGFTQLDPVGFPQQLVASALKSNSATLIKSHVTDTDSIKKAKSFTSLKIGKLHDPFLLPDAKKAIDRLNHAIDNQEKIFVWGDYDVTINIDKFLLCCAK